ncbi:MAG TPA: diacylglycerol kinase family protein [Gemmatimonadaceae bacterium]
MAPLTRRVLLVVNPASRHGLRNRTAALNAFRDAGVTVDELVTEHPGHASSRLRDGPERADAVFVLGGDGIVMEVAGALQGTGVPIGVLPGGTGNLVAGVLRVPRRMARAVPILLAGSVRRLDLGRLPDGRCFAFAAGIGVDVDMVLGTTRGQKKLLGILAYAITATRSAFRRRAFDIRAEVDGNVVTGRVVMAMVANAGALFGGRLLVGPDIRPDDGELDLCLFSATTIGEVLGITWRIVRRDFRPHPRMRFLRGKRIKLSSEPQTAVQADGDLAGMTPVEIVVVPGAAAFLIPRES